MTAAQARAISRAHEQHIRVAARGTVKSTGERFFVVNGSKAGSQYIVTVGASELTCTCPAGQNGILCKHRAAVHETLAAERTVAAPATATLGTASVIFPPRPTQPDAVRACERTFDIFKPEDRRATARVREAF